MSGGKKLHVHNLNRFNIIIVWQFEYIRCGEIAKKKERTANGKELNV